MRNTKSVRAYELEGSKCPYFLNNFDLNLVTMVTVEHDNSIEGDFFNGEMSDYSILDDMDFT